MRPQKILAKAYSKNAHAYMGYASHSVTWNAIERPALDRNLKGILKRNSRVLEAGCGFGRVIHFLIHKGIPQTNIVGIDSSPALLEVAKEKFSQTKFIQADLKKFIPSLGKFDVILCIMTLEHFDKNEIREVLNNFYSYLKKDGTLLCISAHPLRTGKGRYAEEGWRQISTSWGLTLPFYHQPISSFVNVFTATGFCIERMEDGYMPARKIKEAKRYKEGEPVRIIIRCRKI